MDSANELEFSKKLKAFSFMFHNPPFMLQEKPEGFEKKDMLFAAISLGGYDTWTCLDSVQRLYVDEKLSAEEAAPLFHHALETVNFPALQWLDRNILPFSEKLLNRDYLVSLLVIFHEEGRDDLLSWISSRIPEHSSIRSDPRLQII